MKNRLLLYVPILFLLACGGGEDAFYSGAPKYNFNKVSKQDYPPQEPCAPEAVIKLNPQIEQSIILIGYCEAKSSVGKFKSKGKNIAMDMLRKCACTNGSNFIHILSHDEAKRIESKNWLGPNAPSATPASGPSFRSKVSRDKLYAAIYLKP